MTNEHCLHILQQLSSGTHPTTGEKLPDGSPCNEPEIVRALFAACRVIETELERRKRRGNMPPNSGKSWTAEEDQKLIEAFDRGVSSKMIASDHKRSLSAIFARLMKLGKIREGEILDGFQIQRPRFENRPAG